MNDVHRPLHTVCVCLDPENSMMTVKVEKYCNTLSRFEKVDRLSFENWKPSGVVLYKNKIFVLGGWHCNDEGDELSKCVSDRNSFK